MELLHCVAAMKNHYARALVPCCIGNIGRSGRACSRFYDIKEEDAEWE
jgi:hypothetical protein